MFQGVKKNVWVTETLNWLALLFLVAILSLLFARIAEGMPRTNIPPGVLPPIEATPIQPATDPTMPDPAIEPEGDNDLEVVTNVWRAMEWHRCGAVERALPLWRQLKLPAETGIWRQVAMVSAHLRLGETKPAADLLEVMELTHPDNPVVHYYKGILLLTEAATAPEWYDAIETKVRFVSYTPKTATRVSSLYRLAAIYELEHAIELADNVDWQQRLLPPVLFASLHVAPIGTGIDGAVDGTTLDAVPIRPLYDAPMPLTPPTTGDLLTAIGADNFVGRAHNMLGPLHLDRGALHQAEEHMDAAVDADMNVLDGYRKLAERYAGREQYADAFRASLKDMAEGGEIIHPGREALRNLKNWLWD